MGVYIKSMKMPEDGHILSLVLKSDGKVIGANYGEVLGKAVEVPTPHGRLIEEPKSYDYSGLVHISSDDYFGIAKYFAAQVRNQPTVIGAEDGE